MPEVGDLVRIASTKGPSRDGVVTGVVGHLLQVKWSTGEQSTIAPGPGSLDVIGNAKKAAAPAKATKAKKSAKKAR